MKPDIGEYYNIEQAALFKAGIDPRTCCNRIEKAVERKVKNYQEAEDYYFHLQDRVRLGEWEKTNERDVFIHAGGTLDDPVPFENYITGKDLLEWCEQTEAVKEPERSKPEIHPKTENTYKKLIVSLLRLVVIYEGGGEKPDPYKNREILKRDGSLSFNALKELLKEIDPNTPAKADEFMRKLMKED